MSDFANDILGIPSGSSNFVKSIRYEGDPTSQYYGSATGFIVYTGVTLIISGRLYRRRNGYITIPFGVTLSDIGFYSVDGVSGTVYSWGGKNINITMYGSSTSITLHSGNDGMTYAFYGTWELPT